MRHGVVQCSSSEVTLSHTVKSLQVFTSLISITVPDVQLTQQVQNEGENAAVCKTQCNVTVCSMYSNHPTV